MQVIIYKQPTGVIAIVRPAEEVVALYGIHAIALKDIPAGYPFKIVDASEIPADRSLRSAWTIDDEELTDGVGAAWDTFEAQS
jgi:hypothetical protein